MSELEPKPKRRGQIRFPPDETAVKGFEVAMIVISLACVAAVLAIVLGTDWGDTFRPQI
jgi:hypothetical protein